METIKKIKLETVNPTLLFSNLDEEKRISILEQKSIIFQGRETNLKELLSPLTKFDLDEFIDSDVLSKISRNEKIEVGRNVDPLDAQDKIPYVPQLIRRTYFLDSTTIGIEKLSQLDRFDHKDMVTIGGVTGSGKSTFLTSLANAIKQKMPNLWVLKVDLNRYLKSFHKIKRNNLKPVTLLDLLNSLPESRLRSDFEKKIFSIPDKVIILLDAVDEVLPEYKDMVLDVIKDCQGRSKNDYYTKYTINFLVLAASMNLQKETGHELTHTIDPFSQKDQETFLKKYWEQKFELNAEGKKKCGIFAKAVVQEKWFNEGPVGIPLLIRLWAEILEIKDNFKAGTLEWEDCYNFLFSANSEPVLPKKITVTELFQLYIYKNCSGNSRTKLHSLRDDIAKINSNSDNYLQILALETIFHVNICMHFNCYKARTVEVPQDILPQFNILKKIDNELQFTHKTFAEYFVVECISSELRNYQNQTLFKFLFDEIFPSDGYKVVRAFLDSFLLTDINFLPKKALKSMGDSLKLTDYDLLLYTSAREGLLELLKFLFECCRVADVNIDIKNLRVGLNHAVHQAAQGGHFEIVKFLTENGSPIDVRNDKDCTVLHLAAKTGNMPMVKFLVERGVEIDCKDAEGRTALHEASKKGSLDMVRYLLERGAYINSRDKWGYTPLHLAAWMGDVDMVKYFVENGAGIHYRGERSGTVLSNAVLSENLDVVEYLVEKGADVMVRTKSGGSMLHVLPEWDENTRMENVLEVWEFLLEKGVDINSVDDCGETVLLKAVKNGYKLGYVKFLVEHGADVNTVNNYKNSPLTKAMYVNDVEIVEYLMDSSALFNGNHNQTEIYEAIRYHRLEVVKFLGNRGVSLDVRNGNGHPAIDIAICNDDLDMIKLLVQNDVKVDGPDVLALALENCNCDTVKFLVDTGANANLDFGEVKAKDLAAVKFLMEKGAKFKKFHTVGNNLDLLEFLVDTGVEVNKTHIFSIAADRGNLGIVKFLLEKGIDVNMIDERDDAGLHLASKRNHVSVIKCLLDGGADIEIKDGADRTPLYVATSNGCAEAANLLIDRGADIQNATSHGRTALRNAMQKGCVDTIRRLIEHDTSIDVKNKDLGTSLSEALMSGFLDVAEFLAERHQCKVEEVVNRLVNTEVVPEEDKDILDAVFHRVRTVKYLIEKGVEFTARAIDKYAFLFAAVSNNDFKLVKYLIEIGCDVNIKDYCGYTALHKTNDLKMAKLLIENGGNVNAKNAEGVSVLHKAVEKSNLDMCKLLVEHGADINDEDESGQTLLHMERYDYGSISIDKIKYLIKEGATLKRTKDGRNVLYDAVATSHVDLDLVKYLLRLGEDVNCLDHDGNTPLDGAIAHGDLDVVRLLVENGAEVDNNAKKTGMLFNAVTSHCHGGWDCSLDMVKYLVSKGANVNAKNEDGDGDILLHQAISERNFAIIKFLIDSGADVNATDNNGSSLLHKASKSDNLSLVKYLIEKGASMDAKTATGRTVLHEAASSGSYAVVKFFLDNGADVNVRDREQRTPLHDLAAGRHTYFGTSEAFKVAGLLIERGAEVNVKSRKGHTPLYEAVPYGNEVELLVEKGADVNVKDEYGRTPLFALVTRDRRVSRMNMGHDEEGTVRFLVKSGANVNEKADSGRTVLHEAAALGIVEMVKVLEELGADVNARSLNDCTPLHDAAREGMLEVVEFLVQKGADIQAKNKRGNTALDEASNKAHGDIVDFFAKGADKVDAGGGN